MAVRQPYGSRRTLYHAKLWAAVIKMCGPPLQTVGQKILRALDALSLNTHHPKGGVCVQAYRYALDKR